MKVFLLDLWLDLREKRLAPVAVALLAGIIAVPLVLAKGQKEEAAVAPQQTTTTAAPAGPVVQSNPQEGAIESKLQTFSPRDPFEPKGGFPATSTGTGTESGSTSPGTTGGTSGTGTTGGGTGETGGGATGGGTTGGGTTGTTTPEQKTTLFTYTVDIRFGPPGDQGLIKGVDRLQLIPDETDTKIVFLGVTSTGKTAVFLVDSSLGVDTNGRCKPSSDECTFLYLRPDDEHDQAELTDQDGNTFRLHLLKIHRVSIGSSTGGGNSGSGSNDNSGRGNRSPAFTGSADSHQDDATAPGESAPPGEPSEPFTFRGFFGDEGQ
jgi:hypothetical protein